MTGPYRELVLQRLLDLAAMGADGLFFDFRHLPPRGCWDTALARRLAARTGAPPPAPDDCDPLYQQFLDFKAEQIEETFVYWRDQVKARIPERSLHRQHDDRSGLDGPRNDDAAGAASPTQRRTSTGTRSDSNFSKQVFGESDSERPCETPYVLRKPEDHVRQALGWTVLRDAADGRPPHIWARGVPNSEHAQAFAGSLLTFGSIANMDVLEYHLTEKTEGEAIPQGKTPPDALKDAFALGNAVSPHLAGTQPLRWAAVHFGERSRNERGGDFRAAWRETLWPVVGAYQVLTEDGVPVGIVNDQQLEHGELDRVPRADTTQPARAESWSATGGHGVQGRTAVPSSRTTPRGRGATRTKVTLQPPRFAPLSRATSRRRHSGSPAGQRVGTPSPTTAPNGWWWR